MSHLPPTLLLFVLSLATPPLAAQPVGRLFHTPEERAQLDTAKYHQPESNSTAIHYQGLVQRSQGPTTRWINGKPQQGKPPPGLQVGDRAHSNQTDAPHQALLQGGKIIIHPPRTP